MQSIKVIIADSSVISKEGLSILLANEDDIQVVATAKDSTDLMIKIEELRPNVLLIDYCSYDFVVGDINTLLNGYPELSIIGITPYQEKEKVRKALSMGVQSHLSKDCDRDEILEAIRATHKGEQFFCGKIVDAVVKGGTDNEFISCDPLDLSKREIEILQLIADGLTNKEIADHLFLSSHTVVTHRKNIMAKLNINNTAGLVMYAVKEQLVSPNKYLFS